GNHAGATLVAVQKDSLGHVAQPWGKRAKISRFCFVQQDRAGKRELLAGPASATGYTRPAGGNACRPQNGALWAGHMLQAVCPAGVTTASRFAMFQATGRPAPSHSRAARPVTHKRYRIVSSIMALSAARFVSGRA